MSFGSITFLFSSHSPFLSDVTRTLPWCSLHLHDWDSSLHEPHMYLLWSEAPACRILLDLQFVKECPQLATPPLSVSFSLSLFHRSVRRFFAPWDCRLGAERRPAAETLDLMKLRPCLDLREVSQSSVAKSTDGLWDCFVLGPDPKMAQILKSHWLVRDEEDRLRTCSPFYIQLFPERNGGIG